MRRPIHPYFRVAVVWLALLVIWLCLGQLRAAFWGEGYSLPGHVMSALLATLLTVPLLIAARRWLDGGTLVGLGLALSPAAIKPFIVGALAFLIPSALGFALVIGLGWVAIAPTAPVAEILAFVPLLIVLVFLFEALPEELAFRGYVYSALAEKHTRIVAVLVQAVLFALWGAALWMIAVGGIPLDRLVLFFAIGVVLGMVRVTTGSVWAAIGLHTAFQTVAQLVLHLERGHFTIDNSRWVELLALGIIPFSFAVLLVSLVYRRPVVWRGRENISEMVSSSAGSAGRR